MQIVVAGAAGWQGRGALWYLLNHTDISHIIAADLPGRRLDGLATQFKGPRVQTRGLNLLDIDGSAGMFRGAAVVLNCAYEGYPTDIPYHNLELAATRAALDADVNYVGLGGAPVAPEQLALGDEFKSKGRLAILEMGVAPGLTQIMAAYAIQRLDRTNRVDIYSGARDLVVPEEHTRPLPWFLEDRAMACLYRWRANAESISYDDGELRYAPPRAHPEVFSFRDPVGPLSVTQTPGGAVTSLAHSFPEIRHIGRKTSEDPDFEWKSNVLSGLGIFSSKPLQVGDQQLQAWDVLMALLDRLPTERKPSDVRWETRVIVAGERDGKAVEYQFSSVAKTTQVGRAGLCGAIAAAMLARGEIQGTGIQMPEQCIPADDYLIELGRTGVEDIEISTRERF